MYRLLMTAALIGWLGISAVQAATLDISIAAQGNNYTNLVRDAKIRGDGGLADANIGASGGLSDRFYANFLGDGTTPSGRQNNFLQWFDVSSIPPGSTINSATLTQYFADENAHDRIFVNVKLSRLQPGKSWAEGVSQNPATDGSVTWNNQVSLATGSTPWATAGATDAADIDLTTTQTFDVVGNYPNDVVGPMTNILNITSWVQGWVNTPANNTGMLWWGGNNDDDPTGRYFPFGVKENGGGVPTGTVAPAPTLVIDYTLSALPNAVLLINPNRSGDIFSVSFASQSGVTYTLQHKNSVTDVTWIDGNSTVGDGSAKTLTDTSTDSARFYRVSGHF